MPTTMTTTTLRLIDLQLNVETDINTFYLNSLWKEVSWIQ
jgi:hypothetical protein